MTLTFAAPLIHHLSLSADVLSLFVIPLQSRRNQVTVAEVTLIFPGTWVEISCTWGVDVWQGPATVGICGGEVTAVGEVICVWEVNVCEVMDGGPEVIFVCFCMEELEIYGNRKNKLHK